MSRRRLHTFLLVAGLLLLAGGLTISRAASAPVDEVSSLALGLAILITAAVFGGDLAGRFRQPAVLGELLAGILLGNLPGLRRLQPIGADPYLDVLSRIGMLLLLFEVGLGLSVRDLFAVGPSSMLVAVFGTVSSFALGFGAAALLLPDAPHTVHAFLGAATTATSVGITARVLKDIGASRSGEAQIILGAAVIDDVLALVVLGVAVGWLGTDQGGPAFAVTSIAALVAKTLGFLTLALVLGMRLTPSWFRQAARMRTDGALLAVGLCFCFFLSWAASAIGLAALIGAFAAGLVLEDAHSEIFVQRGERSLNELLQPMTSFLVPVFFVLVGLRTNLSVLADSVSLGLPLALTVAAVIGKLSCALGVVNRGVKRSTVAIGMVPRGEVALVFAALGGQLQLEHAPLVDQRGYTAILAVVILTTLVTPPALKWSLRRRP